ncbi:hypothetical protein Q8F55_003806 [Vanrija albida]|uniref:Uncharacterized protein n=1 Tax=Vanrija albida TaxID=181172 RepID=A0ABR3Q502_9TREE
MMQQHKNRHTLFQPLAAPGAFDFRPLVIRKKSKASLRAPPTPVSDAGSSPSPAPPDDIAEPDADPLKPLFTASSGVRTHQSTSSFSADHVRAFPHLHSTTSPHAIDEALAAGAHVRAARAQRQVYKRASASDRSISSSSSDNILSPGSSTSSSRGLRPLSLANRASISSYGSRLSRSLPGGNARPSSLNELDHLRDLDKSPPPFDDRRHSVSARMSRLSFSHQRGESLYRADSVYVKESGTSTARHSADPVPLEEGGTLDASQRHTAIDVTLSRLLGQSARRSSTELTQNYLSYCERNGMDPRGTTRQWRHVSTASSETGTHKTTSLMETPTPEEPVPPPPRPKQRYRQYNGRPPPSAIDACAEDAEAERVETEPMWSSGPEANARTYMSASAWFDPTALLGGGTPSTKSSGFGNGERQELGLRPSSSLTTSRASSDAARHGRPVTRQPRMGSSSKAHHRSSSLSPQMWTRSNIYYQNPKPPTEPSLAGCPTSATSYAPSPMMDRDEGVPYTVSIAAREVTGVGKGMPARLAFFLASVFPNLVAAQALSPQAQEPWPPPRTRPSIPPTRARPASLPPKLESAPWDLPWADWRGVGKAGRRAVPGAPAAAASSTLPHLPSDTPNLLNIAARLDAAGPNTLRVPQQPRRQRSRSSIAHTTTPHATHAKPALYSTRYTPLAVAQLTCLLYIATRYTFYQLKGVAAAAAASAASREPSPNM